jgi:hypothetical protein
MKPAELTRRAEEWIEGEMDQLGRDARHCGQNP